MKVKQKRVVKGYKITPSSYNKAQKRKGLVPLASLIEKFVTEYGRRNGWVDFFVDDLINKETTKQAKKKK